MGLQEGQLVFTKSVQTNVAGKTHIKYGATKGANYAVLMLGVVQKGDEPPNQKEFFQLLGNAGVVSIEDIVELFEKDSLEKVKNFLIQKYKTVEQPKPNEGNKNGSKS